MLTVDEKATWDAYCQERLLRYEMDKKDPIYNYRDVLRQNRPGQFVWELLQNAEDAKATRILFELDKDGLTCHHDSKSDFSIKDAKSISKIGVSEKFEKAAIGKFGIGFKSVFKYAERAEIHSGNLHFALEDYVKIINNIPPLKNDKNSNFTTQFRISFSTVSQKEAFKETKDILDSFSENSILFLDSLQKIEVQLPGFTKKLSKLRSDHGTIEITDESGTQVTKSRWLYSSSPVETDVLDGNGNLKFRRPGYIAIALQIEYEKDLLVGIPLKEAQVFTYFPLAHQESNLKFHIHAPFAIDLGRTQFDQESKSKDENRRLIDLLANQIASLIEGLITSGKVDMRIVELLPVSSDQIHEDLAPIRAVLINLFRTKKLITVFGDNRVTPDELFSAPEAICEQFDGVGLSLLNAVTNSKFSRVDPGRVSKARYILPTAKSSRINSFMRQVGVAEIDSEQLLEFFHELNWVLRNDNIDFNKSKIATNLNAWLLTKSDEKIRDLYILLSKMNMAKSKFQNLPIFRTYGLEFPTHNLPGNTYLASSESQMDSDVLIRHIYFKTDVKVAYYEEVKEFFESLGFEEKDPWVMLKIQIANSDVSDNLDKELERMKNFLHFYREDKDRFLSMVKNRIRLIGTNNSGQTYWSPIADILISKDQFDVNTLNELADESDRFLILWEKYGNSSELMNFLEDLGITKGLRLVNSGILRTLPFLEIILNSKNLKLIKVLWDFLPQINKSDLEVFYSHKRSHTFLPTSLGTLLKDTPWIPTKDGEFLAPELMVDEKLHSDFHRDDLVVFQFIDYGAQAHAEKISSEAANIAAVAAGFEDAETMKLAAQIAKDYSKEELKNMLKIVQLREKAQIDDVQDATEVAIQREGSAPRIEQESVEIYMRTSYEPAQEERKISLRKLYGDAEGNIPCQLCHRRQMPFKVPRNEYGIEWDYFEAVALFKNYTRESEKNALALCPTCSAKIRYFRKTSVQLRDKYLVKEILKLHALLSHLDNEANQELEIALVLLGDEYTIKFNQEHVLALFAVVESNGD